MARIRLENGPAKNIIMKKCPFCAEEIQDAAIKCKHCGEFLKKKNKALNCLFGCLLGLAVFVLLSGAFIYLVSFAYNALMYKMLVWQGNLPHLDLPFTPHGAQVMFDDLGEGFGSFQEFLSNGSLKDYQRITF